MRRIRNLARDIGEKFHPLRVILFGSYARGTATPDSDVDLMVVFKSPQRRDKSLRICRAIEYHFALDLIVIDEARLAKRLGWNDFFLMDVVETGKVLYEANHS
jgi:predicted nucleotidyltransferase